MARTSNVCGPLPNEGVVKGEEHGLNGPPSIEHSNLEPGSLEENVKVGVLSATGPDGPDVIRVSGGVRSGVGLGPPPGRVPDGENVVVRERVVEPPAGTEMLQLRPAPLSWRTPHSQVSAKLLPLIAAHTELKPDSR